MTQFLKTKEDITAWLDEYQVKNYTLIPDEKYGYTVNVDGPVWLNSHELSFIPVKFGEINGEFQCSGNQFTSLEFCPHTIDSDFFCAKNNLISLEFCPTYVGGTFYCYENKLTSLEFCPQYVGGDFICNNNQVTSLEYFPQKIEGSFFCDHNPGLAEYEDIDDFDILYEEHLKIKIQKEKSILSDNISTTDNSKNKTESFKI